MKTTADVGHGDGARSGGRHVAAAAIAGVVACVFGVGVAHLVAAVTDPSASPVPAVGSTVIDLTPTPVKEWAVATFGNADKVLLVGGVAAVTLAAAAGCGVVGRRRPVWGIVGLVALVALAGAAAMLRPAATPISAVPALAASLAGAGALLLQLRLLGRGRAPSSPALDPPDASAVGGVTTSAGASPQPDRAASDAAGGPSMLGAHSHPTRRGLPRRAFLTASAGLATLGAAAGVLGQRLAEAATTAGRALPRPRTSPAALPAGLERQVSAVTALRTPQSSFYRVDTALVVPRVDVDSWKLTVDGSVSAPFTVTYDDLLAMPLVERDITLTCVSNEVGGQYAGGARWLGVEVADLLRRAGIDGGADQILSTSTDGYTASTPTSALLDDRRALIAVGMNGEPLDATHGFPARLLTPGLYGYVGATKWLTRLTATTFAAQQAYWTQRGWAEQAPIKTMARIDTPQALRRIPAGRVAVAGVAWAQRRGIRKVEVRIDGGDWQEARLGPEVNIDYWRQWWLPWTATSGQHSLAVRATDGTGAPQTEERAKPFPNGASGIHEVVVLVD